MYIYDIRVYIYTHHAYIILGYIYTYIIIYINIFYFCYFLSIQLLHYNNAWPNNPPPRRGLTAGVGQQLCGAAGDRRHPPGAQHPLPPPPRPAPRGGVLRLLPHARPQRWGPLLEGRSEIMILKGSCLKTGQHSIFVITRKIKRIIHVCWIPYLLKIL